MDRIYLDNAATSHPKPDAVLEAMRHYAHELGASGGRGAYREAVEAGGLIADCRRRLARLIGASDPNHVVFTLNCTEALNLAIHGLLVARAHAVTTTMDHNSILRPLNALRATRGIEVTFVPADRRTGRVHAEDVIAAFRPETRLVAIQHASNVTGALQPIEPICREARRRGIICLVDAAQSAGHVPIDVEALQIDLLAVPGHKGLLGPLGTGALYIRPGLEREITPLVEGGTGSVSESPVQPEFMPDRFESGSHNAIGLAGLDAALAWIEQRGVGALRDHDRALSAAFLDRAGEVEGLTVFGPVSPDERVAVFSVRLAGYEPAELAALLESEFGLLCRSGIMCAPLAHTTLGTAAGGGTTRLSFGPFNSASHVERAVEALSSLAAVSPAA